MMYYDKYFSSTASLSPSFECRSDPSGTDHPSHGRFPRRVNSVRNGTASFLCGGMSALILKFPPNFVRQLSTKARRNCSNIGVAQIVAASWSNNSASGIPSAAANLAATAAAIPADEPVELIDGDETAVVEDLNEIESVQLEELTLDFKYSSFLSSDGSMAIHAGERLGRGIVTDAITTPVVNTSAYFFKKTAELIDSKATVIDPADIEGLESALNNHKVSLFFTESPTNPLFRCVDIKLVSELCHRKGALVCIDGTFATPLNQKALALGADLVLHSATKFIGGHNDVLGGCISGSTKLVSEVRNLHHVLGGTLNPNAFYLIIRGMKTLHLRVQQQNLTALRMAQILEAHPKVKRVYYPGLPSHPEHHIAKQQMTGFGGVVSFEVDGDLTTTIKFVDSLKIPYTAPSFGGCESIVDQPAIMSFCWDLTQSEREKYGIKDNLVRFSFGVEDFEDLKADIIRALESILACSSGQADPYRLVHQDKQLQSPSDSDI